MITSPAWKDKKYAVLGLARSGRATAEALLAAGAKPRLQSVPASALSPSSSAVELQRRQLQKGLASGWNTWSYNMLEVVKLPHSFGLNTALCRLSSGRCLSATHIEDEAATTRTTPCV